jgi:V-type H+-transporting ATPase subunit E
MFCSTFIIELLPIVVELSINCFVGQMQGLLRLKEPAVLLRCRKEDHHHVESVLHSAKNEYASKANVHEPEIIVDHSVYLPPAPSDDDDAHGHFW